MTGATLIVDRLLESSEDELKDFIFSLPQKFPRITTSFSTIHWPEGEEDYTEENGWIDEEGESVMPDPADDPDGFGMDTAQIAAEWLYDHGASEVSSTDFHPGLWYSDSEDTNYRTGEHTTKSFHLEDFTPEEERKVFQLMHKRWRGHG